MTDSGITDLISRAAAIAWFFRPYSNEEYYSNLDVERALKAIPTVDAIPVEWLKAQNNSTEYFKTIQGQSVELILELWQKEQEAR